VGGVPTIPTVGLATRAEDASGSLFQTHVDATNIILTYIGTPPIGTVSINWFAYLKAT
jgi:hypothetical protein